jgi:magnesium chelatase subunit D
VKPIGFPFPALVGLEPLKTALLLAAIDLRLSVLIRGDKGTAKSTAARALADLLVAGAPFVNLPIGATEDRLLGGLDVEKALKGEPALKPGLLAAADGGVLYIDEVNLLPDHLADALLDASASGVHVVEREGFSVGQDANFVLVGSMNPEEGALRPQLLDRFALVVDVAAPMDPGIRRQVIERRLLFDADPAAFDAEWRDERECLSRRVRDARARVRRVVLPGEILDLIAEWVAAAGVRSLRADLAVVRGSRALAALDDAQAVTESHVAAVLPLALAHRASHRPPASRQPTPPPPRNPEQSESDRGASAEAHERVFAPTDVGTPRLVVEHAATRPGTSSRCPGAERGVTVAARRAAEPRELDVRATLVHAVARRGASHVERDDLHERVRAPQAGTRFLFIVDSSGSHAAQERMRVVKGAVSGILDSSPGRRDEVVLIACRGASASVLLEPTSAIADAQRALEYLPTGGRTPLAHALELASRYVTDSTAVVLITDGHANVPTTSDDPWADALVAARGLGCPSIVIDSEDERNATGGPALLAEAMRGTHVRLADLDQAALLQVIRGAS